MLLGEKNSNSNSNTDNDNDNDGEREEKGENWKHDEGAGDGRVQETL